MCSLPSSTGARPTTSLPIPFARSGTAGEADGGNKFDLDSYNSTYFDLLRYTVQQMNARGIWVSVMLWPGAQSDADGGSGANGWDYNPFKAGNNFNSIDGNPTGDNTGWDMESTQSATRPRWPSRMPTSSMWWMCSTILTATFTRLPTSPGERSRLR